MPKIQQYVAQVQVANRGGTLATPEAFGGGVGAGDALTKLGDFLEQKVERDARFQIQKDMTKVRGDWLQRLDELEQSAPAGAPDFTKNVMSEYRTAMQQMVSERSLSRENANLLALEQEQTANVLLQRALSFEARSRAQKRATDAQEYAGSASRNVFLAPFMFQVESDALPKAFENVGLSGAPLDEMLRKARTDLAQNAIRGMIEKGDLAGARAAIVGGPTAQYVSGDMAAQLTNAINREQQRLEAQAKADAALRRSEARADIEILRQDTFAEISATGKSATADRLKQAYRVAYADKPELARRLAGQVDNAISFYTTSQRISGNTLEQDNKLLLDARAAATGENAAQKFEQVRILEQAIARKRQQLDQDGFNYVVQTHPELRAQLIEAQNDPTKFRQVLATIDARQKDLGVPTWRRTYLGAEQATATVQEINALMATDPEKVADRVEALAKQYGPLWGNSLNELVGKGLNPTVAVAARFDEAKDAFLRRELVSAVAAAKENREQLAPEAVREMEKSILEGTTEFLRTLAPYGASGSAVGAREIAAAQALALARMRRGEKPNVAAKGAVEAMFDSRYDYQGTYRTPKSLGGTVASAASRVQKNLSPDDFVPLKSDNVGLSEAYRQKAAYDAAKEGRGIWVNTPDGRGIQLLNQYYDPVLLKNGKPVMLMFNALPEPEAPATGVSGMVAP
jgi:hypothetical protein